MTARWARLATLAAISLCNLGSSADGTLHYDGFLRRTATACRFESHPNKAILHVDSSVCSLAPQYVGLYVKATGRLGRCLDGQHDVCFRIVDLKPAAFDPIASK